MKGLPREKIQSFYDYPNPFSKNGVSRIQALLWPCTVFTVSISQQKSDDLNIFEKVILKLLYLGIRENELAKTLCIQMDFLRFWLERLAQIGYLKGNGLTDAGRKFVECGEKKIYKNALIYREEAEGRILPFCSIQAPQFVRSDERGAYFGNPANPDRIHSPITILPGSSKHAKVPAPGQILDALRRFKAYRSVTPMVVPMFPEQIAIYDQISIEVLNEGQFVYLYCPCVLAPNGRHALVYNPFGYFMFQEELGKALSNAKEFAEVMEALVSQDIEGSSLENGPAKSFAFNYQGLEPDAIRILAPLAEAATALTRYSGVRADQNRELQRERRKAAKSFASNICTALESMLGAMLKNCEKDSHMARLLKGIVDVAINNDAQSNAQALRASAEKLCLEFGKDDVVFLGLTPEEARGYRNGRINLRVLFAINLFAASPAVSDHPFWRMAVKRPGVVKLFWMINETNNAFGHGQNPDLPDQEMMEELFAVSLELLELLDKNYGAAIADLRAGMARARPVMTESGDHVAASLHRHFPAPLLAVLSRQFYELLWDAEDAFVESGLDETDHEISRKEVSSKLLKPLYAFCQAILHSVRAGYAAKGDDWQKKSLAAATMAGFRLVGNRLPNAISGTQQKFIDNAFRGGKTTLGGELIALLCSLPEEMLIKIADKSPAILINIDRLISLRGHNANIGAEEAMRIRGDIYADILPILQMMGTENNF